ncbi:MAG: hypothetical protein Q4D52_04595 [Eubacteriales bacterium]|nr:hypothetical protein [Eubacteriales bacterium]
MAIGPHLVAFPIFMITLSWFCGEVEDRFFRKKGLSEMEKARLKDL